MVINIIFAVALLLSTFSGYIEPSRFIWISFLSYGYFLLLLANLGFIIFWLILSRWSFLVSAAAILARATFIPLFFQVGGSASAEPAPDQLKIMTFNTHSFCGLDSDTLMTADSGATLFLHLLHSEQPDVVCMQEFNAVPTLNLIDSLSALGYTYRYGTHGAKANAYTVLYSRLPFASTTDMDRKSKFYADVLLRDDTIRICCVHLDSYQLVEKDQQGLLNLAKAQPDSATLGLLGKMAETVVSHEYEWAEELKPLIDSSSMAFVLVGDFNDTPASYLYQQATRLLTDCYTEQGRGFGTTYHGPFPAFRIDYILHSHKLKALAYKRIKTNISDHYPIVATLKVI